jgi:hypothetical protein
MSFDLLVESLEAPLDLGAQGPLARVFEVAREQDPFWASLGSSLRTQDWLSISSLP